MSKFLIPLLILIPGLINFVPIVGLLGQSKLESLYGVELRDPILVLLMRHRALLFGTLGGYMIFSAFRAEFWLSAIVMGLVSMVGFVLLALPTVQQYPPMKKIVIADVVATLLLASAWALMIGP